MLSLKLAEKVFAAEIHAACAAAALAPKFALKFAVKVGVMTSAPNVGTLNPITMATSVILRQRNPRKNGRSFMVVRFVSLVLLNDLALLRQSDARAPNRPAFIAEIPKCDGGTD